LEEPDFCSNLWLFARCVLESADWTTELARRITAD